MRYGIGERTLSVPPGIETREILPKPVFPVESVNNTVRRALRNPIGTKPLYNLVKDKKNICLIVSDGSRSCNYTETLPVLLDEILRFGGVCPDAITILVATGMHRFMTDDELARHLGEVVLNRFKVVQHDGSSPGAMRRGGRTTRGTIVFYNPIASDSDLIILTGSITYHYFAGFTGGRKALFPGVAAGVSILENHSLTLDPETGDFHDRVRPGSLLGNPVHEDMMDAVAGLKPDFLLDVVLTHEGKIAGAFAGDYSYAHRVGCQFVENHFGFVVGTEEMMFAKIVVASAGGHPRDLSFYQAHKSLVNATNLLDQDGGYLVLLAECHEGMGHDGFETWREYRTRDAVKMRLAQRYSAIGHLALSLRGRSETHRIFLLSDLSDDDVRSWGMEPAVSISQALGQIFSELKPPFPPITVMPYAALTTPIRLVDKVGITSREMAELEGTGLIDEAAEPVAVSDDDERSELAKKLFG